MQTYLVTVKNDDYDGKVYGVQFNRGKAIVSDEIIDPIIGLNAEQVAAKLRDDFGYEVKALGGEDGADKKTKRGEKAK